MNIKHWFTKPQKVYVCSECQVHFEPPPALCSYEPGSLTDIAHRYCSVHAPRIIDEREKRGLINRWAASDLEAAYAHAVEWAIAYQKSQDARCHGNQYAEMMRSQSGL